MNRLYNCRADAPDPRDYVYQQPVGLITPSVVDLREHMPAVWQQGRVASCTAHALAASVSFLHPDFEGSRMWLYYKERLLEGTVDQDCGAQLRDGIKVIASQGFAPESSWPYRDEAFNLCPDPACDELAKKEIITSYHRLNGESDFRACLAEGFPFVVGIMVYDSFETQEVIRSGMVPLPQLGERMLGGHAVCIVGYRADGSYILRNSWGPVGDQGHFYLPREYLASGSLAMDAWTVRK